MTTSTAQAATPIAGDLPEPRRSGCRGEPAIAAPALDRDDDGAGDDEEREEEVRHHGDGVQVEKDGDAPEGNLGNRAERGDEGNVTHPPRQPFDAPRGEPGDEREDDADEGDHPVAELDRRVPALLRIRLVATTRPVVAAEAGGGEADDGTARDDDPEREERDARELDESPGRDGAANAGRLHGIGGLAAAHRSSTPDPSTTRPTR